MEIVVVGLFFFPEEGSKPTSAMFDIHGSCGIYLMPWGEAGDICIYDADVLKIDGY